MFEISLFLSFFVCLSLFCFLRRSHSQELTEIDESEAAKVSELSGLTQGVKERFDQFYAKKYQEIKDIIEDIKNSKISVGPERSTSTSALSASALLGVLSPRVANPNANPNAYAD
jgi:hypothetical protein